MKTIVPTKQYFNKDMLKTFLERHWDIFVKIRIKAQKKLRPCDVGRKKKFKKLEERFKEIHERKTAEEADYKTKIIKEGKKGLPCHAGKTMRFHRFVSS